MDTALRVFSYVATIGVITFGYAILNWLLAMLLALVMYPFRDSVGALKYSMLIKNAVAMYLYGSLIALAADQFIGQPRTVGFTILGVVLGALSILTAIGSDMQQRRKQATAEGCDDRLGLMALEPILLLLALLVFVVGVFASAVTFPAVLRPVLSLITWIIGLPIISWIASLIGFGFTVLVLIYGTFLALMLVMLIVKPGSFTAGGPLSDSEIRDWLLSGATVGVSNGESWDVPSRPVTTFWFDRQHKTVCFRWEGDEDDQTYPVDRFTRLGPTGALFTVTEDFNIILNGRKAELAGSI